MGVLASDVAFVSESAFDHVCPIRMFERLGRQGAGTRVGARSFGLPHESDGPVVGELFVPFECGASEFGVELVSWVMIGIYAINLGSGGGIVMGRQRLV